MKLLKEIVIILICSSIIALLFNINQFKPLPLIRSAKINVQISDSLLFDTVSTKKSNINPIEPIKKNNDTIPAPKPVLEKSKPSTDTISSLKNNLDKTITYTQLLKIINNPKFLLIDARHKENYLKAKIGNAINISPYEDEKEMMNKILDLPREKTIVVYCDGGNCDASHELAKNILSFGYEKVFIYTGGWDEWTKKHGIKD